MSTGTRAIEKEDNASYVCTGKIDWKIVILVIFISIMEILADVNFSDETNTLNISRSVVVLFAAVVTMLIVSRISYQLYAKNVRRISVAVFLLLLLRFILIKVDLLEPLIYSGWIKLGSFYFYIPALLLVLGCLVLGAAVDSGQTKNILEIVLIAIGLLLCNGWKWLIIYLIMTGVIFSVRFAKGYTFLIYSVVSSLIFLLLFLMLFVKSGYWDYDSYGERISAFLDPFNSILMIGSANGLYMIKSGGFWGQGIGGGNGIWSSNTNSCYLVSKMVQDMGWFGFFCFILLFAALCWRIVLTIVKAPERIGFYIGTSILLLFFARFLATMMMNLNLIPFVDITLPFLGGGSQWAILDFSLLGVVLNISRYKIERV